VFVIATGVARAASVVPRREIEMTISRNDVPRRLLHTMIRVRDLDRSLAFWCDALGMRELRREDHPTGGFTLSFVGYGDEAAATVLELTHNHDPVDLVHGTAFGHVAVAVDDLEAACRRLEALGVDIRRPPGPMAHRSSSGRCDLIAFVADPDGTSVELIEVRET